MISPDLQLTFLHNFIEINKINNTTNNVNIKNADFF